jgi:hypothetical protein
MIATSTTKSDGVESDLLEQQYNLGLLQPLTPYLTLRLGYQYVDYGSTFQDGTEVTRRTQQPLAELLYSRERLSGRVAVYKLSVEEPGAAQDFDRRSLAANLS